MIEIDSISMLADVDTDHSVAEIEARLKREGYTLNYFPISGEDALLVDALRRRLPNLYGEAFGGIEELCLQGKWSQADGEIYRNVRAPRSATGPSLRKVAIGSGPWLGLPIQACLRVFPRPAEREIIGYAFAAEAGREAFEKALFRSGARFPLRARMDGMELTPFHGEVGSGEACLVLCGWGDSTQVEVQRKLLSASLDPKKGRLLKPRKEADERKYFSWLHARAAEDLQSRIDAEQRSLPASHRALSAFLKDER